MNKGEIRYCIHNRSERQQCKLCNYRSSCCKALVIKMNLNAGIYRCEACNKKCQIIKQD